MPAVAQQLVDAAAVLVTELGEVEVRLWPRVTPLTVDNFVGLAQGTRSWTDPITGRPGNGPFYDGTGFFRRVPGFLVQGGDRTGTGHGGPGYRIPEELALGLVFDRPFLLAMASTGRDGTGSQFFITLAPAPHLDGRYTIFGEVAIAASRSVALAIAEAAEPIVLRSVSVAVR